MIDVLTRMLLRTIEATSVAAQILHCVQDYNPEWAWDQDARRKPGFAARRLFVENKANSRPAAGVSSFKRTDFKLYTSNLKLRT